MNSYVIIISAMIVAVSSNSVHRNTGWGAPQPPSSVNVELAAALASSGAGSASSNLQLTESASGPAYINSYSETFAGVEEFGEMTQVANIDTDTGSDITLQFVTGENSALGAESVSADIAGMTHATAVMSGGSEAAGYEMVDAEKITVYQNAAP